MECDLLLLDLARDVPEAHALRFTGSGQLLRILLEVTVSQNRIACHFAFQLPAARNVGCRETQNGWSQANSQEDDGAPSRTGQCREQSRMKGESVEGRREFT